MKKIVSLSLLTFTILFLYNSSFASYKPGTYKGSAQGHKSKNHSGLVEVEVAVTADKIESVKVLTYEQSVDNKKYGSSVKKAKKKIPEAIVEKQSLDVDGITKATVSSNAIELAVAVAIEKASTTYKPGTYKATAQGHKSKNHSGIVTVEVTVSEVKIESIKVLEYEQSLDSKKYGPLVAQVKEKVPVAITEKQTLDVDGVTKATRSSNALKLAVAKALEKAR